MKLYLGDGVYAEFDGCGIMLTTSNGISITNTIYLEPEVYVALTKFVAEIRRRQQEAYDGEHQGS